MLVFSHRHGHKNTVLSVKWNSNGNWVLTASRDQTIKVSFLALVCLDCNKVVVMGLLDSQAQWIVFWWFLLFWQLYDIRTLKELESYRGHRKEVTCMSSSLERSFVYQCFGLHTNYPCTRSEALCYSRLTWDCLGLDTALAWHPFHEDLFVSGSYDGSIIHWLVG